MKKPIVSLCISPVLIAKSVENTSYRPLLSLGSTEQASDYNIVDIHNKIASFGVKTMNTSINEICVDEDLKIISAPCYMMDVSIHQVFSNIQQAIIKLKSFLV